MKYLALPVYAASVVSESATGTDSLTTSFVYFGDVHQKQRRVSDAISAVLLLDALRLRKAQQGQIQSAANCSICVTTVGESCNKRRHFSGSSGVYSVTSITELATGTDTVNGRPFWEIIDDTQDANWQNIGNTQTAGWTGYCNNLGAFK